MKKIRKVQLQVRVNSDLKSEMKRITEVLEINFSDFVNEMIQFFRENGEINGKPYHTVVQEIERQTGMTMADHFDMEEKEREYRESLKMDPTEFEKLWKEYKSNQTQWINKLDEMKAGMKVKTWEGEEQ